MTKEQEAIEYLKESVLIYKNTIPKISESIDTVLSMLKEKDRQIDFYKKGLEREIESNRDNIMEIIKKDKIIDLMAEFIKNNMSEKKLIKEICLKGKCNNEECHEDDWNNCIKQYFERKATNNG